jgi:hypothetical protein
MRFSWHAATMAMTGRQLLAQLQALDAADPAALDRNVEFTCPDLDEPWSVGEIYYWGSHKILLAPHLDGGEDAA